MKKQPPKIRRQKKPQNGPVIGMIYGNRRTRYMYVCFGTDVRIDNPCKLSGVLADAVEDRSDADCVSVTNTRRGSCGWVVMPQPESTVRSHAGE